MREEQVTKAILSWLISNGWDIICFDFPQSGTGKMLHPNNSHDEKNKDAIIPDIVAVKNGICVFFENKDRFYYPDYVKQNSIKTNNVYSEDIRDLLYGHRVHMIYYGIGLPSSKHTQRSENAAHLVDFVICVNEDKSIKIVYNPSRIMFV